MKKIEEMLEQLTPEKPQKSGLKVLDSFTIVNPSDSESIISMETNSSNITKFENAFKNLEIDNDLKLKRLRNKVDPTSLTKNWYPRPTPPDI